MIRSAFPVSPVYHALYPARFPGHIADRHQRVIIDPVRIMHCRMIVVNHQRILPLGKHGIPGIFILQFLSQHNFHQAQIVAADNDIRVDNLQFLL